MARSATERLQEIANQYMAEGNPWPATARDIAAWAIGRGLWRPQPEALVSQCADLLSKAMREEYATDPQGRPVRTKHAARVSKNGEQLTLWADIRTAGRAHMQVAFQQRRQQIVGDCRQLRLDVDSYNQNRCPENPIQVVFDFTDDLNELLDPAA